MDFNLNNEQKMIHSRSIHDIVDYLSKSKKNINLSYSINVRNELISKLNKLISD